MPSFVRYDPAAALSLLERRWLTELEPRLLAVRDEVAADVELFKSRREPPAEKQPLDAGFIELPRKLLDEPLLDEINRAAESLRESLDRFVVLGIGGSYMGARALFEAQCEPYHNELPREMRGGVPRIYFEGHNLDSDAARGLLDLLSTCSEPGRIEERWGLTVISKSGGTLETGVAFRVFRQALEEYYGRDSDESRRFVVPITGESGRLRELALADGYPHVFPVPDGVGGRFSVLTAVGLFPAAMMGLDICELLRGAAEMTERFFSADFAENPVLQYVAVCHLMEREHGLNIRVLSTWGSRLEAVGLWYDQLLSESLGKQGRGATPITAVNTRDLHSRGQQHQQGARDKLITNLIVQQPQREPVELPPVEEGRDLDGLNKYAGRAMPEFLSAAIEGTNRAYAADRRPTADIILPQLDEHALGQLFQMLMLATVLEGRLTDINPYGQPGVEAYKKNMIEILDRA